MKTLYICCLALLGMINPVYAEKGFSIGAGVGYTNDRAMTGEGYLQMNTELFQRRLEPKAGFMFHANTTSFKNIDDLDIQSAGLFAECVIYPFRKYLYAGVRWELINVYWFTDEATQKLNRASVNATQVFTGTSFYGVVGVNIPLGGIVAFNIYGMPGVRQYRISDGDFSSGNYTVNGSHSEEYVKFAFQANIGLTIKIK